ncbi:MAG: potassium channel family protein [Lachnospiraceae bacterium]
MKIVIVGGGKDGACVARLMLEAGNSVTVIENSERRSAILRKEIPRECVIDGNGAEPPVLEKAGILTADVVVAVTGTDEANLVISKIAKFEYGVPKIIARVSNPKNEWLYNAKMGVDIKVSQASQISQIITDQIDLYNMITQLRLNRGDNAIINATVNKGSKADGKTLKELALPDHMVVIAIERDDTSYVVRRDTRLSGGDHILAYTNVGEEEEFHKLIR